MSNLSKVSGRAESEYGGGAVNGISRSKSTVARLGFNLVDK